MGRSRAGESGSSRCASPTTISVPTAFPSRPSRPISIATSTTALSVSNGTDVSSGSQVASGEPFEVFTEPDHGQRVERFGLESRVDDHDA